MATDYLVVKYFEKMKVLDICQWVYEKVSVDAGGNLVGKVISEADAKKLVKKGGLVLTQSNEYGKIWDTPERDFQERYKGIKI